MSFNKDSFPCNLMVSISMLFSVCCNGFEITPISEELIYKMKTLGTWKQECPISIERLKVVKFYFYNFEGVEQQNGEIVVLDAVANRVLKIFKHLHKIKFPIAKACPIEHYQGNDDESMIDNNSSGYSCRFITGNNNIPSIHSYGLAIDINPVQNPYITIKNQEENYIKILPNNGKEYINRNNLRPGMVESIVEIFKKNGFIDWGGKWIHPRPIDWQHFQLPRPLAQLLAIMPVKEGEEFFEMFIASQSQIFNYGEYDPVDSNQFVSLYVKYTKKFIAAFKHNNNIFKMSTIEALNELNKKL